MPRESRLADILVITSASGSYADVLGPEQPDVAPSLNNLAGLYYALGNYAAVEPLLQRSLAIMEKALGPEQPDVAAMRRVPAAAPSVSDVTAKHPPSWQSSPIRAQLSSIQTTKQPAHTEALGGRGLSRYIATPRLSGHGRV